jgi:hypothetical protein
VLLTRSRLCPRPKPGSSLHLHVLSTPPAFVLSQDQTLREELPALPTDAGGAHRVVVHHSRARPYTRPAPDAIDEVLFRCRTTRKAPSALTNLDASIYGRGAGPQPIGAHAVEFSKTAAPPGGASSVVARSGHPSRAGNGV